MSSIIKPYLDRLKEALSGCDPATIQDALSDAEEHLGTALEQALSNDPSLSESEAFQSIVARYGSVEETAEAYRELESRTGPPLGTIRPTGGNSLASRLFGVLIDPRAYASFFYMFFSLISGIIYFTWAVTGISLSIGLMVLIIGIPFLGIFLLSVRGIALMEGRLIEALLGVRMPRRPIISKKGLKPLQRVKALLTDSMTWKVLAYMIIMLPLGILYFTFTITMISLTLWGVLRPVLELWLDLPYMVINNVSYYSPDWFMPVSVIGGILFAVVTMHAVKGLGRFHTKIARAMLVRD